MFDPLSIAALTGLGVIAFDRWYYPKIIHGSEIARLTETHLGEIDRLNQIHDKEIKRIENHYAIMMAKDLENQNTEVARLTTELQQTKLLTSNFVMSAMSGSDRTRSLDQR